MDKFIICPCCGQWLRIQDIGFYTYGFPMPLNMRDAVMQMNTQDYLQQYYSNISNINQKPEDLPHQYKEQNNGE